MDQKRAIGQAATGLSSLIRHAPDGGRNVPSRPAGSRVRGTDQLPSRRSCLTRWGEFCLFTTAQYSPPEKPFPLEIPQQRLASHPWLRLTRRLPVAPQAGGHSLAVRLLSERTVFFVQVRTSDKPAQKPFSCGGTCGEDALRLHVVSWLPEPRSSPEQNDFSRSLHFPKDRVPGKLPRHSAHQLTPAPSGGRRI